MKVMYAALFVFALFASVLGQTKTITRHYVPVVQKMASPPLFNLIVDEWSAFKFDRQTSAWSAIPFQFDQLNDKGLFDSEPDGIADATDEIIFLPKDAGDRADQSDWIEDENSKNYSRIELEFSDPQMPEEKAWVYLYHHVGAMKNIQSYLSYKPGPEGMPAADSVQTNTFLLGHDQNGWIDFLKYSGSSLDLIDRFKLRLAGDMVIGPAYEINEDFIESNTGENIVVYRPGPVRAFHSIKAAILLEKLNLPLLPKKSNFKFEYIYTPYSFEITAETDIDAGLLTLFGVQTIRQSLDFDAAAAGLKIFSPSNPDGLFVDGNPDAYNDAVDESTSRNWVMASGAQGTVLLIVDISLMKNSRRRLYYADDSNSASLPDGTKDTGDLSSYGDMGLLVQATGDALISERLVVNFKGYFIDRPGEGLEFGERIMAWEDNPLVMQATEQTYAPAALVNSERAEPRGFLLARAYPNPFSAQSSGQIYFEVLGNTNDAYDFILYDVLGRQVVTERHIRTDERGRALFSREARDANGYPLMQGVYFYKISNGYQTLTNTLIITR